MTAPDEETLCVGKATMRISGKTVSLDFACKSEYEARIVFEDIEQRLKAGEVISFERTG